MNKEIIEKIEKHYIHAQQKHPYFCNSLTYNTKSGASHLLSMARKDLKLCIESEVVGFKDVLDCEVAEAIKEIVDGNKERAIEELLDIIAVCLRGIDVIEGRQALGDPAKKEGVK